MNSSNYKREKKTTTKIWNKIYEKKILKNSSEKVICEWKHRHIALD